MTAASFAEIADDATVDRVREQVEELTLDALAFVEAAGITYRQLDYWCRLGLLVAAINNGRGSGHRRRFRRDDVPVVALVGHLSAAGFGANVDQVFDLARSIHLNGHALVPLGEDGTTARLTIQSTQSIQKVQR